RHRADLRRDPDGLPPPRRQRPEGGRGGPRPDLPGQGADVGAAAVSPGRPPRASGRDGGAHLLPPDLQGRGLLLRGGAVGPGRLRAPGRGHDFGTRLKDGVNRLSRELGVGGRMAGLPYRMVYQFLEPDPERRALKRTLLIQELLKQGVLTFRGFLLPSLAHGEEELE